MIRPSKLSTYMGVAEVTALRSPDAQTQVGAILVNSHTGSVLNTAYNGFVRNAPDNLLPNTRPEKYEYIIHAEMNLLVNCARHGISTDNCFLVCTMSPCKMCMRLMVNAGITRVIARELYTDFPDILKMRDVGVTTGRTEEGYVEITYAIS